MENVAAIAVGYLVILAAGDLVLSLVLPASCRGRGEGFGLSFAFGVGLVSLLQFWGGLVVPGVALAWGIVAATLALASFRRLSTFRPRLARTRRPGTAWVLRSLASVDRWTYIAIAILGLEILANVGASVSTGLEGDGLAVWGIKARIAFLSGGTPLSYFGDPSRQWSHPSYPWLLPASEAWLYSLAGDAREVLAKALFPGFFASILLLLYSGLRRTHSRPLSLLVTASAGLTPAFASSAHDGMADIAMGLYWGGSVLYTFHWLRHGRERDGVIGAMLAMLAAWTKREGAAYLAFQVAVVLIGLVCRGRMKGAPRILLLYVALTTAVLVPWWLLQGVVATGPDDFAAVTLDSTQRGIGRLPVIALEMERELWTVAHWGLLWYLFAGAILASMWGSNRLSRAYLALSVVVPLAMVGFGYVYSLFQPFTDHMITTLGRLVLQQVVGGTLFVVVQFAGLLERVVARLGWRPVGT